MELFEPIPKTRRQPAWAINFEAPCALSRRFMSRAGSGAIVNLLDGLSPDEGFSFYLKANTRLKKKPLEMAKRFAPKCA